MLLQLLAKGLMVFVVVPSTILTGSACWEVSNARRPLAGLLGSADRGDLGPATKGGTVRSSRETKRNSGFRPSPPGHREPPALCDAIGITEQGGHVEPGGLHAELRYPVRLVGGGE